MSATLSEIQEWNRRFDDATPLEVMDFVLERFVGQITIACSLSAEDCMLVDLAAKTGRPFRSFVLDTGRLHEETYQTLEALRKKYGISIDVYSPNATAVESLTGQKGMFSFYESIENRHECCGIRKLEPLKRALSNVDAWVVGLRSAQSVTRTGIGKFMLDAGNGGITKISPLARTTEEELYQYIKENDVPLHPLHSQGYPSIGCAPCTRAIEKGEDIRAGRWWWENPEHKECGLHGTSATQSALPGNAK